MKKYVFLLLTVVAIAGTYATARSDIDACYEGCLMQYADRPALYSACTSGCDFRHGP